MEKEVFQFIKFIEKQNGIGNKDSLIDKVKKEFKLISDRSIFYNDKFAVRFSYSSSNSFSNTVISLSTLKNYDDTPLFSCLVTHSENKLLLMNSTFIKKVSHSSQQLRIDNIRGSINGSDISREFQGIENSNKNFEKLFAIHSGIGFAENLPRIIDATNNIVPIGHSFIVIPKSEINILDAPRRAYEFINSPNYKTLLNELVNNVKKYESEIVLASVIGEGVMRGRFIEFLVAGKDDKVKKDLINELKKGNTNLPSFRSANTLGDYVRKFNNFETATDIKTKIMVLNSNPKGYNIDKLLEFLAESNTVFLFFFIGVNPDKVLNSVLISMFQKDLLESTIILSHWAGRNSRGVTQFEGRILNKLIEHPNNDIDEYKSKSFLKDLINLS